MKTYFEKTRNKLMIALRGSPGRPALKKTIYTADRYTGDMGCCAIDPDDMPQAMVSFCLFEPELRDRE